MLVAFSGPAALTADTVKRALERVRGELGLTVEVGPLSAKEAKPHKPRGHLALISVHGPDKPGVLFRLSSLMAKLKINLTDVNTHRMAESRHAPGFVLFVEAEVPPSLSLDDVRKKLQALGKELGVSITAKAAKH